MSESRSEFEAWRSHGAFPESNLLNRCSDGSPRAGEYRNLRVHDDWEVWQASRRAALEEAIGTLDQFEPSMSEEGSSYYLRQIEMAIRELAGKTKEGQEP
jgi:hypothetical protein